MSEHDDRLTELGRELPYDRPDDARREAVRSSLLLAAKAEREAPRPRWRTLAVAFTAGAAAAAAVAFVATRGATPSSPATSPIASAQVEASPNADLEREVVHDGSGHLAELVRVHAGSLHVASARAGEHVQVATADARIDGDGVLEVSVANDRLQEVTVRRGTATLKVRDQHVVVLAAGQTWKAPVVSAQLDLVEPAPAPVAAPPASAPITARVPAPAPDPAPAPAPAAAAVPAPVPVSAAVSAPAAAPARVAAAASAPARVAAAAPAPARKDPPAAAPALAHAPATRIEAGEPAAEPAPTEPAPAAPVDRSPAAAPRGRTATEQHFAAGYQLLQQGKAAEAARELGVAADGDGDPALAADARYFQAVALARAGRKTEAEHALVAFLDHAPRSLRRGRAAVMLAKLIAERGDRDSARRWFESALADPDPAVVAAARAGIAGL
jgi:TolA-binding protein